MERKHLQAQLTKAADGKISFVFTDETVDRHGDSIPLTSWDFSDFLKSPRLLVDHNYKVSAIVGVCKNLRKIGAQYAFDPEFHDITELARETKAMVEQGVLDTVSVGFMQEVKGDKTINKLLEISLVAIPANPSARRLSILDALPTEQETGVAAYVKGFETDTPAEVPVEEKGAVQDVLDADKSWAIYEAKWGNLGMPLDIINALITAYLYPTALVSDFNPMLQEAIALLQQVVDGTYDKAAEGAKDTAMGKSLAGANPITKELIADLYQIKAGRVLSEKNRTLIQDTKTKMEEGIAALGSLLDATSSPEGDGKSAPAADKPVVKVEQKEGEGEVIIGKDVLLMFRASSRAAAQQAEMVNNVLNRLLAK